ncbi:RGS domain-containing protein [Cokeromyces recurvatus]|uniref:RGS domain-containing protein n=1 Tax=Cokeromyces recurvatus TaxID=90255 RepID=UPI0022204848|nr:RGS domain-containing protein [Cokeromyces recurvatus]KAI7899963.1 RGS domain-containing protein [Cokeromyces recurvatus]
MVFSDITQKSLNQVPSNMNDTTIWSIVPEGLTLETVLEDKSPSPFSLKDFSDYLKLTYCDENLLFYEAVNDYKTQCSTYFNSYLGHGEKNSKEDVFIPESMTRFNFTSLTQSTLTPKEQLLFETLKHKFETILQEFILSDSPQEINIPYEIRHQLLNSYQIQQSYHPSLFHPAFQAVVELLRISAFIPFVTDPNRIHSFNNNSVISKKSTSSLLLFKRQKGNPSLLSTTSIHSNNNSLILPPTPSSSPTTAFTSYNPSNNNIGFLKRITTSFKITRYYPFSNNVNDNTVSDPYLTPTKTMSIHISRPVYSTDWHEEEANNKNMTMPELSTSSFPSSPSPSTPLLPSQQNNR